MRIKNVGQIGRFQTEMDDNVKLDKLVELCSDQFKISTDYINSFRDKKKKKKKKKKKDIRVISRKELYIIPIKRREQNLKQRIMV